jgi:endonuclease-3
VPRFPDAAAVEPYVPSTGFYRNKAKHILAVSRLLMELHGAKQPAGLLIEG